VDLTYIGWPVKSEQEIIIPVDVIILKNKAPAEFVINMEMNFSADNITDCDPSQEGDYCHTQAQLTEIKLGLLDKQDFQVKTMDKAYSDSCIGLDGVVGVTGEEYAPKVNLTFGNDTDPLISIDECDELTIEKVANPDGVYCSQKEFLVELAEKISTIGELREEIQALESAGQYSEANDKRNEENKYSAFSSYLRAQDFSDALNTLDAFNSNLIFQDTGLENWENGGISEQQNYLKEIYNSTNGVKFIIEKNGVNLDTTTITPGIYTVKIDMNELEEITTSDYLILADGTLNPTIDIKVTLADGIKPKLDWFFYNEGYEDDFEELFKNIGLQKTTNAYSTNILNRGEIIKFDERDGDLLNASFFQTYAYPLLVKITGDSTGNTNAKIKLKNNEAPAGDFFEKDMFTEWTGVGSSKGDGCETISTSTEDTTLPYRVPDISISNDTFAFEDLSHNLAQVAPNSKMLLSTVLYLPYNTTTGDTLKIETQMPLYHSGESCTNPPCNLLLDENMSNNKVFELSDVLEKIRNKSVCVYRGIGPSLENKWSLFWNEQEIVKELDALTLMITDVSVCN